MNRKQRVLDELNQLEGELFGLNRWMYEHPEVGFREYGASERLTNELEQHGFQVTRGAGGMETAFVARYQGATAGPSIALFAEYDALPNIGHACGHNIIGTSAVGAALALIRSWPDMPGSLYVFGGPAEEQSSTVDDCGGKVHLIDAGLLNGIDAAMMVHPGNSNSAYSNHLAVQPLEMIFHGKPAQPAGSAHLGINAFEAAVLAYTNINACRQYFKPDHYVHGMITESGPAPNITSPRSVLRLHVRAPRKADLELLLAKVKTCGEAAAMVTGAKVEFNYYMPRYLNVINNSVLGGSFESNLKGLGLTTDPMPPSPRASTDMGNVSQVVPAIHAYISLGPIEQVGNTHNPEFALATVTEHGETALRNAAAAMAMTVIDLLEQPELVAKAKSEFDKVMAKAQ